MPTHDAAIAVSRFGLGARPGDVARISHDPRGYLLASLEPARALLANTDDLRPSNEIFAEAMEAQREVRKAREMAAAAGVTPQGGAAPPTKSDRIAPAAKDAPGPQAEKSTKAGEPAIKPGRIRREAFRADAAARFQRATTTDDAFIERLVMFWSNHFCVSVTKAPVRGIAGAFEREAIRPHVLGRFGDMLKAVEQHPAMLVYLDNQVSIGPDSRAGMNRKRGLNENLAREILELHTLGVDGGYTQADVTEFARVLTGWTVAGLNQQREDPGRFMFAPMRHEPGERTVAGRRYSDRGVETGEAVLADMARRPETARHIAAKFARHFLGDDPPAAVVTRLETSFRSTDGDLRALARTLIEAPESWQATARVALPPYDFLIAVVRGCGIRLADGETLRLCAALGQPLWQPPSPKGWPDGNDAWTSPAAVRERLRVSEMAARRVDATADPRALADDLLGERLGGDTRSAVARAETRAQGFELLVMSPEFQRR
ncbi:MAG: DUF1800 family protein [Hyphomicrobiaceae bacterium]